MAGKKLVLQVGVDVGNGVQNLADLKAVLDAIAQGTGKTNQVFAQLSKVLQLNFSATKQFAESLGLSYGKIAQAVVELKKLEDTGADIDDAFQSLSDSLGLSRDQFDALVEALTRASEVAQQAAEAAQQTGSAFNGIGGSAGTAAQSLGELVSLAQALGTDLDGAEQFAAGLNLTAGQASKAIALLRELQSTNASTDQQFEALSQQLGITASQFKSLSGAIAGIGTQRSGIGGLASGISNLAFGFNNVIAAAKTLIGTLGPGFDLLIGQNERLNSQVISAAANLAATTDVVRNGLKIEAPTEAIKALQGPLRQALLQVQKDSLNLVGITSGQLTETFTILTSQAGQLANQSKEIPDPIAAAGKLTIDFAAALGVLGIPLAQARQEINSILAGTIDQNSVLAKQLGITNQQVQQYKQQGELVSFLQERLKPFTEANALNAKSIAGITSNFQELLEVTARVAGEPLLGPLVEQLNQVYQFLTQNQEAITQGAVSSIQVLQNLLEIVGGAIARIAEILLPVIVSLGDSLKNGLSAGAGAAQTSLEVLAQTAVNLVTIATPLLKIVADIVNVFSQLADTDIGRTIIAAGLLTAGFVKAAGAIQILTPLVVALRTQLLATGVAFNAASAAGFAASLKAAIPAIVAFGTTLATALAPLIALGGAIALTIIVKNTGDLRVANEEIQGFQEQIDATAQQAINLASRLKALNEIQKQNGSLTAEQAKEQAGLRAIAEQQVKSYEQLLSTLDSVTPANAEQAQSIENLKAQIRSLIGALNSTGGAVTAQGRQLQNLGTTADQLKEKVQGFQDVISRGAGDPAQFEQAVKGLIDSTQQQLDLGLISAEEAQSRLAGIVNNTQATYEQQIAAQQALTKVQEQAGEDRVNAVKQQENEVRQLQAEGKLTDAEAEQELTQIKVDELQTRLENVRQYLKAEEDAGRGNGRRAIELRQQEADIIASIAETQAEAEKKALEERLKEIERTGKEAIDAATLAETQRQIDIQKLVNSGVLSEEEANQEKLQSTRERIQAELSAEQQKLEQLRSLPSPTDPDERRNLEEEIRGQIQKTAQLQLGLLENERQQQEATAQAAIKASQAEAAAREQASQRKIASIEREKAAQDVAANAIQRQTNLLQAQQGLQQALGNLAATRGQIEVDRLNQALQLRQQISQAEDAGVKRVLQAQLARLGVSGSERQIADQIYQAEVNRANAEVQRLQQAQDFAVQANELEIKRNELLAQRAVTEARIAELRAAQEVASKQADLAAAEQTVDPTERERAVAAAQTQVDLSQQGLDLARQATQEAIAQVDAQQQISDLSRQTLSAQQATERATAGQARQTRIAAAELSRAQSSARQLSRSLTSTSQSLGVSSSGSSFGSGSSLSLPGFKEGGVAGPGPAIVGEAGPEIVKFGSPSRVWSNEDSQKIASQLLGSSLAPGTTGVPIASVAPAGMAIASGGNMQLLKAIETLNQNLSGMGSGITVQNLQHSATYQVPRDLNAIAEMVDQAQIGLINKLRSSLGGY